jgi:hypothetical protein
VSNFLDDKLEIFYSVYVEVASLSPEQAKKEVENFFKEMKNHNEGDQGGVGIKRTADSTDTSFSETEECSSSSEEPPRKKRKTAARDQVSEVGRPKADFYLTPDI